MLTFAKDADRTVSAGYINAINVMRGLDRLGLSGRRAGSLRHRVLAGGGHAARTYDKAWRPGRADYQGRRTAGHGGTVSPGVPVLADIDARDWSDARFADGWPARPCRRWTSPTKPVADASPRPAGCGGLDILVSNAGISAAAPVTSRAG